MASRCRQCVIATALAAALCGLAHGTDVEQPRGRGVDVDKAKAREADKQRLIAKLHAEVPKQKEPPAGVNPLAEPIFHRHDRP